MWEEEGKERKGMGGDGVCDSRSPSAFSEEKGRDRVEVVSESTSEFLEWRGVDGREGCRNADPVTSSSSPTSTTFLRRSFIRILGTKLFRHDS
jgi:hypothetical protein